jgi:TRAP-type mannitol/chloroaromatic compound transport system substrate-binding protein
MRKAIVATAAISVALLFAANCAIARELKMATSWQGGQLLDYGAKGFAAWTEKLTNGSVKIKVYPGGTLGSPLKIAEAVRNGVADVGHSSPTYEWGVNVANVWLGGFAGGLDSQAMLHWLYEGGGLAIYREFRRETHGVIDFPCGMTPREAGLHSIRPIRSAEDFKGMKFRAAGAFAQIAGVLGASAVNITKDETLASMERGVLDAADFSTLSINIADGIHKVAKYLIVPGIHQPINVLNCPINVKVWESLSDHERMAVELAAKLVTLEMGQRIQVEDADALKFYISQGVEVVRLNDDFLKEVKKAITKWTDDNAQKVGPNHWFVRIRDHQRAFAEKWDFYESWR